MKKLHLTILLIASLILGGSATLAAASSHCPPNPVKQNFFAKDDGKDETKTSGGGETRLSIHPDTRDVEIGCYLEIVNHDNAEIHITSGFPWLNHPKTTGNITLGPAVGTHDQIQKFIIHATDIGTLDPRARMRGGPLGADE